MDSGSDHPAIEGSQGHAGGPELTTLKALLARFLPKESYRSQVLILSGGTIFSQVLLVAVAPILTRLYTASDFGVLQAYLSISLFYTVAIALKFDMAVMLPSDDDTGANLVAVSLAATLGVGSAGALILFLCRNLSLPVLIALKPYLWLVPLSACGAGSYQVLNSWALRKKQFRTVATTKFTQAFSNITVQLGLGYWSVGPIGLLIGETLGRTSGTLALARAAWTQDRERFKGVRPGRMWASAIRYKKFPLVSAPSALINTAGFVLPPLLIGDFHGATVLGWFALADRVVQAPSNLIGTAISQAYTAAATKLVHTDTMGLYLLFTRTAKRLLMISVVPFGLIVWLGPSLFALAFGERWREAGVYARILAGVSVIGFTAWPLIPTLAILERQTLQFHWDLWRGLLTCSTLFISRALKFPARRSILLYAVALGLGYAVHFFLSYRCLRSMVRYHRIFPDGTTTQKTTLSEGAHVRQ